MSRPEKFEDLSGWERQGETVFNVSTVALARFPVIAAAFYAVVNAATDERQLEWNGDTLYLKKTKAEQDRVLASKQAEWDERQRMYFLAMSEPDSPEFETPGNRTKVDNFARSEGLDPISWP